MKTKKTKSVKKVTKKSSKPSYPTTNKPHELKDVAHGALLVPEST